MNHRITSVALLMLSLSGCSKDPTKPNGNIMPKAIEFVLLDKAGKELFISEDTPIKVSSINTSGKRFYVDDLSEYPDGITKLIKRSIPSTSYPYHFFYTSLSIPLASSNGSKEWYLELGGHTDTLYYDVRHSRPDALSNQFDVVAVSFNGRAVATQTDMGSAYYVLQRNK